MKEFWSKTWSWLWSRPNVLFITYLLIMVFAGSLLVRDPIVYLIQEFTGPWNPWVFTAVIIVTSGAWGITLVALPPSKHIIFLIHNKHDNPKNWVVFRNLYVDLPKSNITHMILDKGKEEAEKYIKDVNKWLKDNVEGKYLPLDEWYTKEDEFYSVIRVYFSRKSDAMRFKLVFGGE